MLYHVDRLERCTWNLITTTITGWSSLLTIIICFDFPFVWDFLIPFSQLLFQEAMPFFRLLSVSWQGNHRMCFHSWTTPYAYFSFSFSSSVVSGREIASWNSICLRVRKTLIFGTFLSTDTFLQKISDLSVNWWLLLWDLVCLFMSSRANRARL